ncbi:MAG: hypothetical protein DBX55_06780 [Verrucomicrobia bacterium]|nr:MAG: hypothetical protein DBX55_06780 [Verrucomicrobiota bacterium]
MPGKFCVSIHLPGGQMNFFVLRLPARGICPLAPGDAPPKLGELSRALKDSREACKNKFLPLHILFEVRKMARKILRGAGGLRDSASGAIFFCAADCAGESGVGEFLALLVLPLCWRKKGDRRAFAKNLSVPRTAGWKRNIARFARRGGETPAVAR